MRLDQQYNFNQYADSLRANVEACERIMGRKLTNGEANNLARSVGRIQGYIQRAVCCDVQGVA